MTAQKLALRRVRHSQAALWYGHCFSCVNKNEIGCEKEGLIESFSLGRYASVGRLLIIAASAATALALGVLVAYFEFGLREVLIILFGGVAVIALLAPLDSVLQFGLGLGIASIGLGWRTVTFTGALTFAPFEVIIWALAIVLTLRSVLRRERLVLDLSMPLVAFVLWCALVLVRGLVSEVRWDVTLGFGKQMLLILPFFLVMRNLVRDMRVWRRMILVATGTALYLSLTGLLVYLVPDMASPLGEWLGVETFKVGNFERVGFPGWGPLAAWYFAPLFGLLLGFWNSADSGYRQFGYTLILFILGAAILVSGQRGAWVALLAGMVVYSMFDMRRGLVLSALSLLIIFAVPASDVVLRLESAFNPALFDSSAADRYARADRAWSALRESPFFGLGFGVHTYTHSDFLEIGVAAGVVGMALFVWTLGMTAKQLWQTSIVQYNATSRKLAQGAFVMFVILAVELLSSGFVTLSFTAVVIWFLWSMADQYAFIAKKGMPAVSSPEPRLP